ncbi:sulfatase-like hydrolase/transferase [uncultured Gimesia sp.]|uniref:sulfatase-like hydrolase/transferase n=1 Tax=uncultured Gimesia sp. TaxID=1678688 RepID=UPI0030D84D70|tara:strand:- start:329692 stop:331125 length:1434 start_codon:yes stop_codon:yes gene_type:complete
MLRALLSLTVCLLLFQPAVSAEPKQPNILFIMVDDLGKEWISCYGAEDIKTPAIDKLAATGMKFNNAWCMPQCTPTRVTLLTGQYPFRHGWTNHWDVPRWGAGGHFDANKNTTYANVLREAGYATCAAGKWQIDDFRVEPNAMRDAGFDEWCMWTGYETHNPPSAHRYWDAFINIKGKGSKAYTGQFGPDIYCDYLIDFIGKHKDQPMLLYYPMALTHGPLTTTPDNKDETNKRRLFAGMVRYTDKLVGRLVTAIDEAGLRENTIIIFTTDNGTGGISNSRLGHVVRGGKTKMSEQNGTAMPFIVNCPGTVPSGVQTDALIDFTDLLPTFAELGGGKLPPEREVDGKSFVPLILGKAKDSPRMWIMSMGGGPAVLRGGRVVPKLVYDDRVIRDQRFKLWIDTNRKPIKLYDLKTDPWEEQNLIDSNDPEITAALKRLTTIATQFPKQDGAPIYEKNPPQKWDKQLEFSGKGKKKKRP